MRISEDVLVVAALALSDAARGENIYLPMAKARRMIVPALEAAIEHARERSLDPRIERNRVLVRNAFGVRRLSH
ncbi:hypothetical protein SAMN06295912_10187 [Sphingomonas laterariae]|uniref:Uncharacterized protein n=1 Tax=Edaphosphingomonas laterariae TaxID=861865 RepID=A0A239BF40_9SPHN|nr:hypothetical protein [Sphingomonas laterariae]SNS05948.1 hypothetical protein SAMN06295912_10187 [Sphingomonas laterariae]